MPTLRLITAAWLLLLPTASAQLVGGSWEFTELPGLMHTTQGHALCPVGDFDGDGVLDLLVGAPRGWGGNTPGRASIISGLTGDGLWGGRSGRAGERFGESVALVGDMDGDAVPDFLVGAPHHSFSSDIGKVYLYSGATGAQITVVDQPHVQYWDKRFGAAVAGGIDHNQDGIEDFLVGAPRFFGPGAGYYAGAVFIYSGVIGEGPLGVLYGTENQLFFGASLTILPDLDQDGVRDFLVGGHSRRGSPGAVFLHSGATGHLLGRVNGRSPGAFFGYATAALGDVNADGIPDFAVGAPAERGHGASESYFQVISGADLQVIWTQSRLPGEHIGHALAGIGDLDEDGATDLAVTVSGDSQHAASIELYSGATGVLLGVFPDPVSHHRYFGSALAGTDLDGDGSLDLAIGSGGGGPWEVLLLSRLPCLTPSASELQANASDQVLLALDFPVSEANFGYAVLISGAGTGPSWIAGLEVPLTIDPLLSQMLAGWQPPNLRGGLGALDPAGDATATLTGDPALAALVGQTLSLAAVSFDPRSEMGRISSVARALEILP